MVALPFPTDRPWTIDDLADMPDDGQRYELLQGELIVSPAPGKTHQRIIGYLYLKLIAAATRAGSGEVVIAPADVVLSSSNLVEPDLLYLRESQAAQFGETKIEGAPAFVIEIVSPSSGRYDRVRKASLYMDFGVEEYWVIEPAKRQLLVLRNNQQIPNPTIVSTGSVSSAVLTTFTVDIEELFAAADRPVRSEG